MAISENLRRLRKSMDITQEQMAEFLGVSFQTVSKWERGDCFPDIAMLPRLTVFFDISLDELFGMEEIRNRKHLEDTFTRAHEQEAAGNYQDATAILRNAVKTFPNHYGLLSELALSLSFEEPESRDSAASTKEAILLGERVLKNCTNEKVRSTTRVLLCWLYTKTGENQKAVDLARTLPHVWESREMMMPELLDGQESVDSLKGSIRTMLSILCEKIDALESLMRDPNRMPKRIALGPPDTVPGVVSPLDNISKISVFLNGDMQKVW